MEDESQSAGGFCGVGKWWSSFKNLLSSSLTEFNDYHHNLIIIDNKTASSISLGSIFQMMVRTTKQDWNQELFSDSGRSEESYSNKNHFEQYLEQLKRSFPMEKKPSDSQAQPSSLLDKQEYDYSSSPYYELKSTEILPNEPALKHPQTEVPSPLPNLKVRKEKLGDRLTALHQLVAPFGKRDTASVLFETIGYIKFLHGQISAMSSSPTSGNGSTTPLQCRLDADEIKNEESLITDLKSRGLCLVPISTACPLTARPIDVMF